MQVRFWGTRGSIPAPGAGTIRYGGNTACVELLSNAGTHLVLDCGTGARLLGKQMVEQSAREGAPANGVLLIGHTHWDHIQGLPFFAPLFQDGSEWRVYGPRGLNESIAQTLAGQMQYQYFPVTLEQLAAHVNFHDLVEGSFEINDLRVTAQYLNHPALTLGYRIEADGVSVVYSCDQEPFDPTLADGREVPAEGADARHAQFLADADLVIHDAQYRPEEYQTRRGWGHSTADYAVAVAVAAKARKLALFHHDPDHDDDTVDAMLRAARDQAAGMGFAGEVVAAAEGDVIDVQPRLRAHAARRNGGSAVFDPGRLSACVILAVSDPALRDAVCAAAAQEHLRVVDVSEPADGQDTVVVFDSDDVRDCTRARNGKAGRPMLALTRGRPGSDEAGVNDWLVWPSSTAHIRSKLRAALLRRACRWQNAPLPVDEPERLDALRRLNVLDTPAEERFDRYTRDACQLFDVPFALVSLVDQSRQWFKSRQGMDLAGTEVTETPRDQSVCSHAILEGSTLQVPDLTLDDRFADSPIVTGPLGLRFYAGVPLVLKDGSRVGTLCIGDRRPRVLDEDQVGQLERLAHAVRDELENAVTPALG